MTRPLALAIAISAALGCGSSTKRHPGPAGGDAYDQYEGLALIPADTPYAFVSFKRVPQALARRIYKAFSPATDAPTSNEPAIAIMRELGGGGELTPARLAEIGLAESPRISIYGVDGYPVVRFEIVSGDKLLAAVREAAARARVTLPPSETVGGLTVWTVSEPKLDFVFAIAPDEAILALAPRQQNQLSHDIMLGLARPATHIAPAVFRELAARNGFTGQGVGFVDFDQVFHMFARPGLLGQQCTAAIDALVASAPRLVIGFDVTSDALGYRMILELSPAVLDVLRSLATSIPRGDRVGPTPLMTMTAAFDVDRAVAMLPTVAYLLQGISSRCGLPDLGATSLADAPRRFPPYLHGITGASMLITSMDEAKGQMEGAFALHIADPAGLVSGLTSKIGVPAGMFNVQANGEAVELMPGLLPVKVHAAMNERTIALGVGPDGATQAEAALGGEPEPAPLVRMTVDYAQIGKLPGNAAMGAALAAFGEGSFEVAVGDRGLVGTFTMPLR
jgi:hypothetical protein